MQKINTINKNIPCYPSGTLAIKKLGKRCKYKDLTMLECLLLGRNGDCREAKGLASFIPLPSKQLS